VNLHTIEIKKPAFKFVVDMDQWSGPMFRTATKDGDDLYDVDSKLLVAGMKKGDRFIDVGAHIGWYSMLAAALGAKVTAFEPNVFNYGGLLRNVQANDFGEAITPYCMAVGEKKGVMPLYVNLDNDGGHGLWEVGEHPYNEKTRAANGPEQLTYVTTIKDWIGRCTQRLWVKIDTEGFEHKILQQFPFDLGLSKAPIIIAEINHDCLGRNNTSELELRALMYKHGYESFVFDEKGIVCVEPTVSVKSDFVYNLIFSPENLTKTFSEIAG